MLKLTTPQGQETVEELAQRHRVSTDAVMTLLQALVNGNGTSRSVQSPGIRGVRGSGCEAG